MTDSSVLVLLVCDYVSWRLDLFEKALDRLTTAAREWDSLPEIRLGYRLRDDVAVIVLENGLLAEQRLGVLAASAADLPGLRLLDLPTGGPSADEAAARILRSCDLVMSAVTVSSALTRIRATLGMTDDRRRTQRIPVDFACRYETGGGWVEASVRDLSSGGVFIETRSYAPDIGDRIRFELFHGADEPILVEGDIVQHARTGFGARLLLDEEEQRRIYERLRILRPAKRRSALQAEVGRPESDGSEAPPVASGRSSDPVSLEQMIESAEAAPYARVLLGVGDQGSIIANRLAERRCECAIGHDAKLVFELLLDQLLSIDLLVLSDRLPGSSAIEMLHRIRRLGGELDLPVAAVVANPEEEGPALLAAGATAVFPVLWPEELAVRCLSLIEERRRGAGGSSHQAETGT